MAGAEGVERREREQVPSIQMHLTLATGEQEESEKHTWTDPEGGRTAGVPRDLNVGLAQGSGRRENTAGQGLRKAIEFGTGDLRGTVSSMAWKEPDYRKLRTELAVEYVGSTMARLCPLKRYVEVLTPRNSKWELTWKKCCCGRT